jgi:hypothetical protein
MIKVSNIRKIIVIYDEFYHHYLKICSYLGKIIVKYTPNFIKFVSFANVLSERGNKSTDCSV